MGEAAVWTYCPCGRMSAQVGNATITSMRCNQCPTPKHEGGLLAAVDEWCHRRSRYAGWHWRHPLGSLWWFAYRPLCNYRDWRLRRPTKAHEFDGSGGTDA